LTHRAAMPIHPALQRLAKIVEEMPPVGDLESIRCALSGRLGIRASAIAGDNLDAFVALQPSHKCTVHRHAFTPAWRPRLWI
jgi:hypothetical protein